MRESCYNKMCEQFENKRHRLKRITISTHTYVGIYYENVYIRMIICAMLLLLLFGRIITQFSINKNLI